MGDIADMRGLVYRIDCVPVSRFYIGSTTDFAARRRRHLHLLRHGRHHSIHLQRCFALHGEQSLSFSIIEAGIEVGKLLQREGEYIRQLAPAFNGSTVSATRRGTVQGAACRAKVSAANKGRRHTVEALEAISRASVGNRHAAGTTHRRKVTPAIKDRIDSLVAEGWGSYRIAKAVGLSKKTIINVRKERANYGRY